MDITIVDSAGEILRLLSVGDIETAYLNFNQTTEHAILEPCPGDAWWDFESLAWVSKPPQPSRDHRWDPATKSWLNSTPPLTLDQLKAARWEAMKAERTRAEAAPFTWNGLVFDADVQRVTGAATGAMLAQLTGSPFAVDWTLADNSVVTLDAAEMTQVGMALLQHVEAAHSRARALRTLIFTNAATPEEVAAITWDTPIT
jgi:hypothetical protein